MPGVAHHVTQRGNRRQNTFFDQQDYAAYLLLLKQNCERFDVEILAYCLMPNHVHLILVPKLDTSLTHAISKTHYSYTLQTNYRMGWRGHLWQGRFFSAPMDDDYLLKCIRYVELNPVRANLVSDPFSYEWSSARFRVCEKSDVISQSHDLISRIANWRDFLETSMEQNEFEPIRKSSRTGRPLGSEKFVKLLETHTDRDLMPKKRGPKAKME
jgi:putative transposase